MNSYVNLKNEMDNLKSRINEIQTEKTNAMLTLKEIATKYNPSLNDILPKDVNSISTRNLEGRIIVFEEEVKALELEDNIKNELINKAVETKETILGKIQEQEQVNEDLMRKTIELEQRKNYVLGKMQEKEQLERKISEIKVILNKRKELLAEDNWEKEIKEAVELVINRYTAEIEKLEAQLNSILEDKVLAEDIEAILNETQEPKKEKSGEKNVEPNKGNDNKDLDEMIDLFKKSSDRLAPEKKETNNEQKENLERLVNEVNNLGNDNKDEPEQQEEEEEPKKIEEPEEPSEPEKELENLEEDEELENLEEEDEEEYEVVSSSKNEELEEELKTKKKFRIALGISSILEKIRNKQEQRVNKKSVELIKDVKFLAEYEKENLTKEEYEYTVKTANQIVKLNQELKEKEQVDKSRRTQIIRELRKLNRQLHKYIEEIYKKPEFDYKESKKSKIK